jgi:hypothetical protein
MDFKNKIVKYSTNKKSISKMAGHIELSNIIENKKQVLEIIKTTEYVENMKNTCCSRCGNYSANCVTIPAVIRCKCV